LGKPARTELSQPVNIDSYQAAEILTHCRDVSPYPIKPMLLLKPALPVLTQNQWDAVAFHHVRSVLLSIDPPEVAPPWCAEGKTWWACSIHDCLPLQISWYWVYSPRGMVLRSRLGEIASNFRLLNAAGLPLPEHSHRLALCQLIHDMAWQPPVRAVAQAEACLRLH
jgi:hypothetical protein